MQKSFDGMPTLRAREEDRGVITVDEVLETLKPFEDGLNAIASYEKKKELLQSKKPELNDEDGSLGRSHDRLTKYAETQIGNLGLGEDTPDILKTYYYVHGLIRYNDVA